MDLTPGVTPTLTVAGRVITDIPNLIVLCAGASTGATSTFRKIGNNTGYSPAGGKSFKVIGVKATGGANGVAAIGQSDNDLAMNGAGVPTNYSCPNGLGQGTPPNINIAGPGNPPNEMSFEGFVVATGKYLSLTQVSVASCNVMVYGYEV